MSFMVKLYFDILVNNKSPLARVFMIKLILIFLADKKAPG